MRIRVLAVGKIKEHYLQAGVADYLKRCRRFLPFEVVEVKEEREPPNLSEKDILNLQGKEAERLSTKLNSADYIIALDRRGRSLDSPRFAHLIEAALHTRSGHVTFLIGGSHGLAASLLQRADETVSFSDLTFPHQLFRLVLCEQCYRALTILKGRKYHK